MHNEKTERCKLKCSVEGGTGDEKKKHKTFLPRKQKDQQFGIHNKRINFWVVSKSLSWPRIFPQTPPVNLVALAECIRSEPFTQPICCNTEDKQF